MFLINYWVCLYAEWEEIEKGKLERQEQMWEKEKNRQRAGEFELPFGKFMCQALLNNITIIFSLS